MTRGSYFKVPETETAKLLAEQAVSQFRATSSALAALRQEMQTLAVSLPEYSVVMEMFGVGPVLGPQLMAEIDDVRRFYSKRDLVALPMTLHSTSVQPSRFAASNRCSPAIKV